MAERVTQALVETVNCKKEDVKIIIREMEKEDYAAGGILTIDK